MAHSLAKTEALLGLESISVGCYLVKRIKKVPVIFRKEGNCKTGCLTCLVSFFFLFFNQIYWGDNC